MSDTLFDLEPLETVGEAFEYLMRCRCGRYMRTTGPNEPKAQMVELHPGTSRKWWCDNCGREAVIESPKAVI